MTVPLPFLALALAPLALARFAPGATVAVAGADAFSALLEELVALLGALSERIARPRSRGEDPLSSTAAAPPARMRLRAPGVALRFALVADRAGVFFFDGAFRGPAWLDFFRGLASAVALLEARDVRVGAFFFAGVLVPLRAPVFFLDVFLAAT